MIGKDFDRNSMTRFDWKHFASKDPGWWNPPEPDEFQRGQLDQVRKVVDALRPSRLLEIGVGRGRASPWFFGPWRYVGVEVNRSLAEKASTVMKESILIATGSRLPFQPETFEIVVAFDVFMHVWDRNQFLDECHRVLRVGGVLVLNFIRRFSPGWRRYVLAWVLHPSRMIGTGDRRFDGRDSVTGLLRQAGFTPQVLMSETSTPLVIGRKA